MLGGEAAQSARARLAAATEAADNANDVVDLPKLKHGDYREFCGKDGAPAACKGCGHLKVERSSPKSEPYPTCLNVKCLEKRERAEERAKKKAEQQAREEAIRDVTASLERLAFAKMLAGLPKRLLVYLAGTCRRTASPNWDTCWASCRSRRRMPRWRSPTTSTTNPGIPRKMSRKRRTSPSVHEVRRSIHAIPGGALVVDPKRELAELAIMVSKKPESSERPGSRPLSRLRLHQP